MLSVLIRAEFGYAAMPLAEQPLHHRFVLSGPLVLGKSSLMFRRPQQIGDRQSVTLQTISMRTLHKILHNRCSMVVYREIHSACRHAVRTISLRNQRIAMFRV